MKSLKLYISAYGVATFVYKNRVLGYPPIRKFVRWNLLITGGISYVQISQLAIAIHNTRALKINHGKTNFQEIDS